MSYQVQLQKAASWLVSIQSKEDFGWGLSDGTGSSLVNTAEALIVLGKTKNHFSEIKQGIEFLYTRIDLDISKHPRTRYAIFTLLALTEHRDKADSEFLEKWLEWLFNAKNIDGGWGHVANDGKSCIYATCMALQILSKLKYRTNELESAYNWLLGCQRSQGWAFSKDEPISHIATAMVVLTLRAVRDVSDPIFTFPKQFLSENERWGIEVENFPGANWRHCTYMWIIPALLSLDVSPYSKVVAEGVRYVNTYNCDSGWTEPDKALSIRGQYWCVEMFSAIQAAYDPAIHPYRIDSTIAHIEMREPDFVNIRIHSAWGVVMPRKVYQWITYALFGLSIMFFTGAYRYIPSIPRVADFIIATVAFICSNVLVKRRHKLFPKFFAWIVMGIVGILDGAHRLIGTSVYDLFIGIKAGLIFHH